MDAFILILIMALPVACLALLAFLMNRWGKNGDPMGGTSKDTLSTNGSPRRPDVYHD